ncbi:archaemetzincin [Hymenobacter sp. B81]|uniref:archaemetzincin n=1 Tax=Hymenobacter sp. B81 TaxID=3344878 RepID=UPI0037DD3392
MSYLRAALLVLGLAVQQPFTADPVIRAEKTYFEAVRARDVPLPKARPGEWRHDHPEPEQTFAQYRQSLMPGADSARRTIYLQPLGSFTPLQQRALRETRRYLAAFFQTPVVLQPARTPFVPAHTRRRLGKGPEQVLASYLLESQLKGQLPPDALALMAFSPQDLYPRPDWNYVFGLASYPDRVGITSLYRLQGGTLTPDNFARGLARLINLSSHEIGHMLLLQHCLRARCAMNGTNSLAETDATPNRFCAECQAKLYLRRRYDNRQRLRELTTFFQDHGLRRDYQLARQDARGLK